MDRINKLAERVADSLAAVGWGGGVAFPISLGLIAVSVWRFWLDPAHYGLRNYWAWGGWLLLCLALLMVVDYVFHHAPIVFFFFSAFWLAFSYLEPHVAMWTGLLLLIVLVSPVVATNESFTDNDLIRAIEKGQIQKALETIRAGADVNAREQQRTALHEAVQCGSVELVRALLESHADVNVADSYGTTPLMSAVSAKQKELVALLLGAGADVNARDSKADTPLIKAAFRNDAELVRALIQAGADVNVRNADGCTALKWATDLRHEEIAAILRGSGGTEEPETSRGGG